MEKKSGVPNRQSLFFVEGGFESFSLECEQKKRFKKRLGRKEGIAFHTL